MAKKVVLPMKVMAPGKRMASRERNTEPQVKKPKVISQQQVVETEVMQELGRGRRKKKSA